MYEAGKVPVIKEGIDANGHWRAVVCAEVMSYCRRDGRRRFPTEVTIGALEDFGWKVDYTKADPYTLPAFDKVRIA